MKIMRFFVLLFGILVYFSDSSIATVDDGCEWVWVPAGYFDCEWDPATGMLDCQPHFDLILDCDNDDLPDPPDPPGGGTDGGTGDSDSDVCPSNCTELDFTFREIDSSSCRDCDHYERADHCFTVTEVSAICRIDDTSRDCCEKFSCINPDDHHVYCDGGDGQFPNDINFDYFPVL